MRQFLNNTSRLRSVYMFLAVMLSATLFSSCDKEELEIENNFPFEVKVMPVPKDVANGQTVEIRITIQRSGNYINAKYYLRYFQFDGQGILQYFDEPPYQPNDLYLLPKEQFRLRYTSNSTVSQAFEVVISDNFGNEEQLSFQFNSTD